MIQPKLTPLEERDVRICDLRLNQKKSIKEIGRVFGMDHRAVVAARASPALSTANY